MSTPAPRGPRAFAVVLLVVAALVGGAVQASAAAAVPTGPLPDAPVYRWQHPLTGDVLYSTDPAGEGAVAGYQAQTMNGVPVDPAFGILHEPAFRLWRTPPGPGFVELWRIVRPNGKHYLAPSNTPPAGDVAQVSLGWVGVTADVFAGPETNADGDAVCGMIPLRQYYIGAVPAPPLPQVDDLPDTFFDYHDARLDDEDSFYYLIDANSSADIGFVYDATRISQRC
jgi:hypothetical protein